MLQGTPRAVRNACTAVMLAVSFGCLRAPQSRANDVDARTPSAPSRKTNSAAVNIVPRGDAPQVDPGTQKLEMDPPAVTLQASVGATATGRLQVVPDASATLWVETRAAVRRGEGLSLIGGESVRVGRPPTVSPSAGPLINLGQVLKGTQVDVTIEVDLAPGVTPGTYESQINWTVDATPPDRIVQNPVTVTIVAQK
jgi:hypothetical protein